MPETQAAAAIDADTLIRSILFVAVFLSAWISFHPFQSLATAPNAVAEGGDLANQLGYSAIFLALAAWLYRNEPRRLTLLLRPTLIALLIWCAITVVTSWEPSLAARRLAFTLVIMSIAAMALLLPKNLRHFSDLLALSALIVLAACYAGVAVVPQLAIHQATDFLEPEHAGSWRGVFPHKNDAGGFMVLLIFVGLYVARLRSLVLGGAIAVLAAIFLAFTQSKTAIGVMPLAFIVSAVVARSRGMVWPTVLVIVILAVFNLCSVGTVAFEPVRLFVESFMPDATFTGRTDLWQLGLQAVGERPITGYGFGAFWGTEQVVYGLGDAISWANAASDAHNAYLNLALMIGIPGLALAFVWAVVLPIADYHRPAEDDRGTAALRLLFLRVCLYGVYASCFESSIFQQVGAVWFFFVISAFGLRYLSVMRVSA
jgi:O-antigen ligase